ncbi:ABATE domain-containing protein [Streptomyces sp. NPDC047130]|uniref:ABATE domain-containing protein n=1 Tax=Streptomyces sp. NPDC047130 TaxID=3155261 RepID=UPI0033C8D25A
MERRLALELAGTIRHDGVGGVADDLATLPGTTEWLRERSDALAGLPPDGITADDRLRGEVVELRRAVRALFARAAGPAGPAGPADARRLMPVDEAVAALNAAAARAAVVPRLDWLPGDPPAARTVPVGGDLTARVVAALAGDAIAFLGGPDRDLLRACPAPRCVRYFVKSHGRQEFCKASCGNRARAARHYRRRRADAEDGTGRS